MNLTNCSTCFVGCVGGVCYSCTVKKAYCSKCNKKLDDVAEKGSVEQICPNCGGKLEIYAYYSNSRRA